MANKRVEEHQKEEIDIKNMLLHYYCGNATADEINYLESWINLSDENCNRAKALYAALLATSSCCMEEQMNLDKAWRKTLRCLRRRNLSRLCLQWTQRVAAMLFIPLVTVTWWSLTRPIPVREPEVQMCEIRVKPGLTAECRLPDSTLVCLNSGSVLRYPSAFVGDTRRVELSGEAYFEVMRDTVHKFCVDLGEGVQIEVLGTHFNIDAYGEQNDIITTLIEGSVELIYPTETGKDRQRMYPGEKTVYHKAEHTMELKKTDGEVELSWRDMKVVLKKTPFPEALYLLSKRYKVEFDVRTKRYENYTFTGTFTNQTIEEVLNIFRVSSQIHWRVKTNASQHQEEKLIEIY